MSQPILLAVGMLGKSGVRNYSGTLIGWCASFWDQSILSSPSTVLIDWLGDIP